ncbi:MAG: transposase [Heteroscytonema crispum UTEX LB 1556]
MPKPYSYDLRQKVIQAIEFDGLKKSEAEPGQFVVMDNATFHKGGRIQQLIQDAGCEILYLPPYSPDLNKIEKCWSWLKSRIRKKLDQFDCLRNAIEHILYIAS